MKAFGQGAFPVHLDSGTTLYSIRRGGLFPSSSGFKRGLLPEGVVVLSPAVDRFSKRQLILVSFKISNNFF